MKRTLGFAVLIWILAADLTCAGDYKMVEGAFIEICEAYLKNLNAFSGTPLVVCERPVHPKFKDFSTPQWEQLDVLQHLDLLKIVEQKVSPSWTENDYLSGKWEARVKRNLQEREFTLSTVRLDINRDGIVEQVIRYQSAGCKQGDITTHFHSGVSFVVMQEDGLRVDDEKTRRVNILTGRPELFLYKDRVFLDLWAGELGEDERYGQLMVYDITSPTGGVPCQYKYMKANSRRKPQ